MGLNIKRKFFGIDKFENYVRINKLDLTITNNFCQDKEVYYNVEFKLSLNSDARDIEKVSSQIMNKEITIETKTDQEKQQLDKFLTGYIDNEKGFGELGSIIISVPIWQIPQKYNIHPLFKDYTIDQIFNFFYELFNNEYKGYLGAESLDDITINQEDNQTFKNKMITKINTSIKQIPQIKELK